MSTIVLRRWPRDKAQAIVANPPRDRPGAAVVYKLRNRLASRLPGQLMQNADVIFLTVTKYRALGGNGRGSSIDPKIPKQRGKR